MQICAATLPSRPSAEVVAWLQCAMRKGEGARTRASLVWVQNAPKMSPRASINCQAGLSSSRQEQMNQTLNGQIKPLKVLKTTQLQRAPFCHPGSPSQKGFETKLGFFGGPHPLLSLGWQLLGGEVPPRLPRSRMSGWQEKSHLFSIWILTSIHAAFSSSSSSPRSPAPSAGVRPRGRCDGLSPARIWVILGDFI